MSQPASFDAPRDGETVLCCRHHKRTRVLHYVGDKHGIGIWVKTETATGFGSFWVRWVCLCRWCELWRRIRRRGPAEMAKCKAEWVGND